LKKRGKGKSENKEKQLKPTGFCDLIFLCRSPPVEKGEKVQGPAISGIDSRCAWEDTLPRVQQNPEGFPAILYFWGGLFCNFETVKALFG
jgi:hypothetical protein